MKSMVIPVPGPDEPETWQDRLAAVPSRSPDVVLAFLPGDGRSQRMLRELAAMWPDTVRFGCESVTQFADAALASHGSLQLFWFDQPEHRVEVGVIEATSDGGLRADEVDRLAGTIRGADAVLLLVDGLQFPAQQLLAELRTRKAAADVPVAGGLASMASPGVEASGARVFIDRQLYGAACAVSCWYGVRADVEIVRGWSPASPSYTVTRAEGNVLYEIDGEPVTDWYRRFFTVGGSLAPLPEAAHQFPLILEGPRPGREGLYRSMRQFDQPEGAVTFWGDLEVGDEIRLGMGNGASLVETARELAAGRHAEAAVLYSCVGREVVLGQRAEAEVQAIHRALDGVPLSGFFTFGEIGPSARGPLAFYNHTAVLVLLCEAEA